ncbi:hypothetical protein [Phenylobacterium sp.]|uniref:hypothetical protein n=1 Tax=Phenylobacterium sp. TaxID=1871053 RepID=UPI0040356EA5
MEQLRYFFILLMQTSMFGLGLVFVAWTCLVLRLPERRRIARILALPALWLSLPVLGGLFYEQDNQTAGWLVHLARPMLFAYLGVSVWAFATLPERRGVVVLLALLNAPFALMSALVIAMAATGDSL